MDIEHSTVETAEFWWEKLKNNQMLLHSSNKDSKKLQVISTFFTHYLAFVTKAGETETCLKLLDEFKVQKLLYQHIFIEVFWLLGFKVHGDPKQLETYRALLKQFSERSLFEKQLLQQRLGEDHLLACGLLNKRTYEKKCRRIQVKGKLEQRKYSLFREENEGYSKLITELMQGDIITSENIGIVRENIFSLIGYFDLDPNRALDVVITAFEHSPENENYITLIKDFKVSALAQIMGSKFSIFQERRLKTLQDPTETLTNPCDLGKITHDKLFTPISIYRITAKLIKNGFFGIQDIFQYLSPNLGVLRDLQTRRMEAGVKIFKRGKYIGSDRKQDEKRQRALLMVIFKQAQHNQILWMLQALIQENSWKDAELLFLSLDIALDPTLHSPLLNTIISLLEWIIEPIYRPISPTCHFKSQKIVIKQFPISKNSQKEQINQLKEINISSLKQIKKLLKYLGIGLGKSTKLYIKICRIIKHIQQEHKKNVYSEEFISELNDIIITYLLPAHSQFDSNPSISIQFWSLFEKIPFQIRYNSYFEFISEKCVSHPLKLLQIKKSQQLFQDWSHKITKTNGEHYSKILGKICHNNPITIMRLAIEFVTEYDNQIDVVVPAFKIMTDFSLDIAMFMIIRKISDKQFKKFGEHLSIKGDTVIYWQSQMQNISKFVGKFLQLYHRQEKKGIFAYICNKISENNPFNTLLLREIIQKMTGCEILETQNLTVDQLESFFGGPQLKISAQSQQQDFVLAKKSSQSLKQFLWKNRDSIENTLAFVLISLLGQQRTRIIHERVVNQENGRKFQRPVLQTLYDEINEVFLQIMQFLIFSKDGQEHFKKLLPTEFLKELQEKYKLQPEIAFHIAREATPPLYKMTEQEYNSLLDQVRSQVNNFNYKNSLKISYEKHYILEEFEKKVQSKFWKEMSPDIYMIFWFSLPEQIYIPNDLYHKKLRSIKDEINVLERQKNDVFSSNQHNQRKNRQKLLKKIEKKKKYYQTSKKEQAILQKLKKSFDAFIVQKTKIIIAGFGKKKIAPDVMIQYCFQPRLFLSPGDAIYCAKFFQLITNMWELTFTQVIENIERFAQLLLPCIHCISKREAQNLGIFLREILQPITKWLLKHQIQNSASKFAMQKQFKVKVCQLQIFNVRKQIFEILLSHLDNEKSINVFNTLIIMTIIKDVFPTIKQFQEQILNKLETLKAKFPSHGDLLLRMKSYQIQINTQLPNFDVALLKKEIENGKKVRSQKDRYRGNSRQNMRSNRRISNSRSRGNYDRKKEHDIRKYDQRDHKRRKPEENERNQLKQNIKRERRKHLRK